MIHLKSITLGAVLTAASLGAFAQAASAPATPHIDQREANQQARIAQGASTGQLTAKETQRLEKEQARINKAETKAKSDGTATKHERKHLLHMEDAASKDIHHQKHDAQVAK